MSLVNVELAADSTLGKRRDGGHPELVGGLVILLPHEPFNAFTLTIVANVSWLEDVSRWMMWFT